MDPVAVIQELDELVDQLMAHLGIPDDDDTDASGRQPTVDPNVVGVIRRMDEMLDMLQEQFGIDDVDKAQLIETFRRDKASLARRIGSLSNADLGTILTKARS